MPPSLERAWSTQYKDDYHGTGFVKHTGKPRCLRKPSSPSVCNKRVPAATKISVFSYQNARGGSRPGCIENSKTVLEHISSPKQNESTGNGQGELLQSTKETNVLGQAIKAAKLGNKDRHRHKTSDEFETGADWIETLVAVATNNSHRLCIEKSANNGNDVIHMRGADGAEMENPADLHLHVHLKRNAAVHLHLHGISGVSKTVVFRDTEPDAEQVIPPSEELRTDAPVPPNLHWSYWPEPRSQRKLQRPNTAIGIKNEYDKRYANIDLQSLHWSYWPEPPSTYRSMPSTPRSSANNCSTESQDGVGRNEDKLQGPSGIDPEIEEDLLNEYQLPATDNKMMPEMNRANTFYYEPQQNRLTSISVNDPPVRDTYTVYNQPRRSQSVTPSGHYNQAFFPYHKPGGAGEREKRVLNHFAKAMEGNQPLPNNYQYTFHKYPFTTRQPRKVVPNDPYMHQFSVFSLTTPRCSGHFVIHPDWVSERCPMRRSRSFVMPTKQSLTGFKN